MDGLLARWWEPKGVFPLTCVLKPCRGDVYFALRIVSLIPKKLSCLTPFFLIKCRGLIPTGLLFYLFQCTFSFFHIIDAQKISPLMQASCGGHARVVIFSMEGSHFHTVPQSCVITSTHGSSLLAGCTMVKYYLRFKKKKKTWHSRSNVFILHYRYL